VTELALIVSSGQGQVKGAQPRLESFVTWSRTGADFSRGQGEAHSGSNATSDTGSRGERPPDYADGLDILYSHCLPTAETLFVHILLADIRGIKREARLRTHRERALWVEHKIPGSQTSVSL